MAFYSDISSYYDKIFPISEVTVDFLRESIGRPPKKVLDVACGTGGYTLELDKLGYKIKGIDLDKKMIEKLSEKVNNEGCKVRFSQGNMLTLSKEVNGEKFDAIYSIGNSLVHLNNYHEIQSFFTDVKKLLNRSGVFIFQIINYDRILSKALKSLPTIVNKEVPLKFERFYDLDESTQKIIFKTILHVENKKIENQVFLTPLKHDDGLSMLKNAGFSDIKVYGDFKRSSFDKDNSYGFIVEAR